jgi:uncharacterized membrane protein YdfJ with MMPL/SSD domain
MKQKVVSKRDFNKNLTVAISLLFLAFASLFFMNNSSLFNKNSSATGFAVEQANDGQMQFFNAEYDKSHSKKYIIELSEKPLIKKTQGFLITCQ